MAALGGAVALEQVHDGAVRIGQHLHLDVAPALHQALDEQRPVAEGGVRLAARGGQRAGQLAGRADDAHPAPAAARGGLDHQGEPDLLGSTSGELLVGCVQHGREHGHAGGGGEPARLVLAPEAFHRVGRRPDERQPRLGARAGERGALRQKPVARVNGVHARAARGIEQRRDRQVGLRRGRGADPQRLVGRLDVRRVAIGVGEHGDRAQAQRARRAQHPQRDLPAVGDEDRSERHHMRSTPTRPGTPGAAAHTDSASPRTRRVSSGSISPSSHSRAVA